MRRKLGVAMATGNKIKTHKHMNTAAYFDMYKRIEILGILLAMFGFINLSMGEYLIGFTAGIVSGVCLLTYFLYIRLYSQISLQLFFFGANILGIVNNI